MPLTFDELGHVRTTAHWRTLPVTVDERGSTIDAKLFVAGGTRLDADLAAQFPEDLDSALFYELAAVGDRVHFAATGALTQYVQGVICNSRQGRFALPLALVGQWRAGTQATRYYGLMVSERRLQRFPGEWLWEAPQFAGRGRMADPAGLRVARCSPPSALT
jgi:hypothetical protein